MKRVLFVIPYLTAGGTNRSLQSLLSHIDSSKYSADVFVMAHGGSYTNKMKNCTILPPNAMIESIIAHYSSRKGFGRLTSMLSKTLCKITNYRFQTVIFQYVGRKLMRKKYDAVVAYSENVPTRFVALMNHPNKIAWIHCDYASHFELNGRKDESNIYATFKSIVCVSEFTKQSFLNIYPQFADKTHSIWNILDVNMMQQLAMEEADEFEENIFRIASIGRIDPVKQLSRIPEVASKLIASELKFRWYIIGPKGTDSEYSLLIENQHKYRTTDYVKIIGEKDNPYSYISDSDLLVNTSKSEACPYVINEAKVLGTPVVCTDFGSASEFIDNGVNGFYTSIDNLHVPIIRLMTDESLYKSQKEALSKFKYDNDGLLEKIYSLFSK